MIVFSDDDLRQRSQRRGEGVELSQIRTVQPSTAANLGRLKAIKTGLAQAQASA